MTPHPFVRRLFVLASVALIGTAVAAAPAAAGDNRPLSSLEIAQLTELMRQAYGLGDGVAKYRDHGGGVHSVSLPIPTDRRGLLTVLPEAEGAEATTLFLLGTGVQSTNPAPPNLDFFTVIDTDVPGYRHWGVVLNDGNSNVTKKATIKAQCGKTKRQNQRNVLFEAGFLVAWWFEPTSGFGVEAVCKQTASVVGFIPGIVTSYFLAVH